MTNPEHFLQPPQDILSEARTYESFNSWLTLVPDERLRYLSEVSAQAYSDEGTEDTATLTAIVGIAMLFSSKRAMSIREVTQAFQTLTTYLATELHVREGDAVKEGIYSMMPGEDTATITLTEKGKEIYGQKGKA